MPRPLLFGIVNITADSFSDGGLHLEPAAAIAHARALLEDGADFVDLGPAPSNPDAQAVSPAEEIERLEPVLATIAPDRISVDSFRSETQRFALGRGVAYLNDIAGFADPALYPELAAASAGLIVMHSLQSGAIADRRDFPPDKLYERILRFFSERLAALTAAGIAAERIVLDPGMGFFVGGDPENSLVALNRVADLKREFGRPVLVSVSRKSFLGALTGRAIADRGAATLAAELAAISAGADMIRTHDVRALADALKILGALEENRRRFTI